MQLVVPRVKTKILPDFLDTKSQKADKFAHEEMLEDNKYSFFSSSHISIKFVPCFTEEG